MGRETEAFVGTWVGKDPAGLSRHTVTLTVRGTTVEGEWTLEVPGHPEARRTLPVVSADVRDGFFLFSLGRVNINNMKFEMVDEGTAVLGLNAEAVRALAGADHVTEQAIQGHQVQLTRTSPNAVMAGE